MNDTLDHDTVFVGSEQHEIAAVYYLAKSIREIISTLKCIRSLSNTHTEHEQFIDERNSPSRIVVRNEIAGSFQILNRFRPEPIGPHLL